MKGAFRGVTRIVGARGRSNEVRSARFFFSRGHVARKLNAMGWNEYTSWRPNQQKSVVIGRFRLIRLTSLILISQKLISVTLFFAPSPASPGGNCPSPLLALGYATGGAGGSP